MVSAGMQRTPPNIPATLTLLAHSGDVTMTFHSSLQWRSSLPHKHTLTCLVLENTATCVRRANIHTITHSPAGCLQLITFFLPAPTWVVTPICLLKASCVRGHAIITNGSDKSRLRRYSMPRPAIVPAQHPWLTGNGGTCMHAWYITNLRCTVACIASG